MNNDFEDLKAHIDSAPDKSVQKVARSLARGPDAMKIIRVIADYFRTGSALTGKNNNVVYHFLVLERLLKVRHPSRADLNAAVCLTTGILGLYDGKLLDAWDDDLVRAEDTRKIDRSTKLIDAIFVKYLRQVDGRNSGRTHRRQRKDDIEAAAKALIKLQDSQNILSPTLKQIAHKLKLDKTSMSRKINKGWQTRLENFGKKVIVDRAAELRTYPSSRK